MKLQINEWKEFKFGNIIDSIYKAKAYSKEELDCSEVYRDGDIAYVTRTENNNSVECFVNGQDLDGIEEGNAIVIGDTTATITYQRDKFVAGDHIVVIRAQWLNMYTGLFVVILLNQERFRYCYGRAFIKDIIINTKIKLPVDDKGNPDFFKMEKYIKLCNYKYITTNNKSSNKEISDENWKWFDLSGEDGIFEIENCKCSNASNLLEDGDEISYIGAKKDDNGFMKRVVKNNKLITKGNCIIFICDGQGSVGYSNYMNEDFIGSTTLSVGRNKFLNKYNGLFIVAVLDLERYRYSYGRKYKTNLNKTKIKLPAIKDKDNRYRPDWEYMENYIKSLPYGDRI